MVYGRAKQATTERLDNRLLKVIWKEKIDVQTKSGETGIHKGKKMTEEII